MATFLALLDLYKEDVISFEQVAPLGDLYVTWTGTDVRTLIASVN